MSRDLPNLGLKGGYADGDDDWGGEQNENLLKLSTLVQGGVAEIRAAVPGSPTPGLVIILDETNVGHPNAVAVWEGEVGAEAWTYFAPEPGWLLWDNDQEKYLTFDGATWEILATGGGGGGASDLADLGDVDVTTVAPRNRQALVYDTATDKWIPGKPASRSGRAGWVAAATWHWTGAAVVIDSSTNVASITRVDDGLYEIFFTEDAPAADYEVFGAGEFAAGATTDGIRGGSFNLGGGRGTSSCQIYMDKESVGAGGGFDAPRMSIMMFSMGELPFGVIGEGGEDRIKASGYFVIDGAGPDLMLVNGINVASITRLAEGQFEIEFDTPLDSIEYGVNVNARFGDNNDNLVCLPAIDRHVGSGFLTDKITFLCPTSTDAALHDPVFLAFEIYDPVVQASGGGGSSGGYNKIANAIDVPPETPSAWDEEWDEDDTVVIPTGWTWENRTGSGSTYNAGIKNRKLVMAQLSPTSGWNFAGVVKDKPVGDFDIITKLTLSGIVRDYCSVALCPYDSVTNKFVSASFHARGRGRFFISWNRWNGFNSLNTDNSYEVGESTMYLRLKRVGTSINAYFSVDGEFWQHSPDAAAETEGDFLPADWDKVGFFLKSENTQIAVHAVCHWIRDYQAENLFVEDYWA
jgi:hypothetical protein